MKNQDDLPSRRPPAAAGRGAKDEWLRTSFGLDRKAFAAPAAAPRQSGLAYVPYPEGVAPAAQAYSVPPEPIAAPAAASAPPQSRLPYVAYPEEVAPAAQAYSVPSEPMAAPAAAPSRGDARTPTGATELPVTTYESNIDGADAPAAPAAALPRAGLAYVPFSEKLAPAAQAYSVPPAQLAAPAAASPTGATELPVTVYESNADGAEAPAAAAPARTDAARDAIQAARSREPKPIPTGMAARPVGDEYAGEHNMAAWRKDWKIKGQIVDPTDTRVTTKLYNEHEQAANRLVQQPDGSFKKGDGDTVAGQKDRGYVMDESGRMVSFTTDRRRTDDPDGTIRVEATHHSTALGGEAMLGEDGQPKLDAEGRPMMRSKPAAAAGQVSFDARSRISEIDNVSGHYKPTVAQLMQAVEYLQTQGAFFEDEITRLTDDVPEGGKHQPLAQDDDDYKKYKRAQRAIAPKLARAKAIGEDVRALNDALKALDEEAQALAAAGPSGSKGDDRKREIMGKQQEIGAALEKSLTEMKEIRAFVDGEQKQLREKGIGPSYRIRKDAKAKFIDTKKKMTGVEVHNAAAGAQSMDVESFLQSGGDARRLAKKGEALEELKSKPQLAQKKRVLDKLAEKRASGVKAKTKPRK